MVLTRCHNNNAMQRCNSSVVTIGADPVPWGHISSTGQNSYVGVSLNHVPMPVKMVRRGIVQCPNEDNAQWCPAMTTYISPPTAAIRSQSRRENWSITMFDGDASEFKSMLSGDPVQRITKNACGNEQTCQTESFFDRFRYRKNAAVCTNNIHWCVTPLMLLSVLRLVVIAETTI